MTNENPNKELLPRFIELETSTRCNRSCKWCPNSVYDRGKEQKYMDGKLFSKITDDLANLSYSGEIALHNYNEPLLDEQLFEHITEMRRKLADASLVLFTNGDYLDGIIMRKLEESGVQTLIVSIHDPDPQKRIQKLREELRIEGEYVDVSDSFGVKLATTYKGIRIVYYIPSPSMRTSRGGIIDEYNTSGPKDGFCYLPFSSCAIDYEGNLKICCEVYPANKTHREHGIIGNLTEATFPEIWFSDIFNAFRRRILGCANRNVICSTCPGYSFNVDGKRMDEWKMFLKNMVNQSAGQQPTS